ncbi:hypothetical protein [Cohnella fermenti]|uniref:Uncharacterized protein n=1 Tax=Cohnella fermenti TaxID=2565925 RepID=A0A4S4BGB6_9BACL|nr:hypothetical protein [Cohnella fermenti]THF73473.1 hypothetical protein E6C55_29235 [Cohnella fermenti]
MSTKVGRYATFWLASASLAICLGDALGSGLANIVLIGLNPLIDAIKFAEPFQSWIVDTDALRMEPSSALIPLKLPAYLIHFSSYALTGLLADWAIRRTMSR